MNDPALLQAALREDFHCFLQKAFLSLNPGTPFRSNWHIEVISHHLELCRSGKIRRLIITIPPRHLKSTTANVAFTAYLLGQDPTTRVICASYSKDLSAKHHNDCRAIMSAKWYRDLWPGTRILQNKDTETEFVTRGRGGRYSTSVGGTLTGRGGRFIIIDDANKPGEAYSETQRTTVNDWFGNTVVTRQDNKQKDVIIIIQQRVHEDDLVGHLLEKGGWTHLNLPAIAEEDDVIEIGPGLTHARKAGELLHPAMEPEEVLDQLKRDMGSYDFASQYLQSPTPLEGGIVKWKWFRTYETLPEPLDDDLIVQSWDTASKAEQINDFSLCTTWVLRRKNYYLIDVYREKLEYPALKRQIHLRALNFRANLVLIEDANSGTALIQDLRSDGGLPITAIRPRGDKATRMMAVSPMIEGGQVFVPAEAPWLPAFQREVTLFPKAKHDDQVDSLSQFLKWARDRDYDDEFLGG